MVKDHSDSEKGNPLPPHRLLLSINSIVCHEVPHVSYQVYVKPYQRVGFPVVVCLHYREEARAECAEHSPCDAASLSSSKLIAFPCKCSASI